MKPRVFCLFREDDDSPEYRIFYKNHFVNIWDGEYNVESYGQYSLKNFLRDHVRSKYWEEVEYEEI